jgi:hypothetical protein
VYDVSGRLVSELISEPKPAGEYLVRWDGTDSGGRRVASGVYFVRAIVGPDVFERKVIRLK